MSFKYMMKPVYRERWNQRIDQFDKIHKEEEEVRKQIAEAWGCDCKVFGGETNTFDFYCFDKKNVLCIGELKDHYKKQSDKGMKLFAVRKWSNLVLTAMGMQVPAYFVVKFADGVFYRHVDSVAPITWRCSIGGRSDRGLQNDREPCFWIPHKEFLPITTLPYEETA